MAIIRRMENAANATLKACTVQRWCAVWIANFVLCEVLLYWFWSCKWPDNAFDDGVVRAVAIADPQITDAYSYAHIRPGLGLDAVNFYTDLFMRRCYHWIVKPLGASVILMLGDLMDGGHFLDQQQFQEEMGRLNRIFAHSTDAVVLNIAGNHDIGMGYWYSEYSAERWESSISQLNFVRSIGNVDIVGVDSCALTSDITGKRAPENRKDNAERLLETLDIDILATGTATGGRRSTAGDDSGTNAEHGSNGADGGDASEVERQRLCRPRILMTHVPLYRDFPKPCHELRTRNPLGIRSSRGKSYANTMTLHESTRLLRAVRPVIVLDGDDHEACTVNQSYLPSKRHLWKPVGESPDNSDIQISTVEHTIPTFNWQAGVPAPAFAMITISDSAARSYTDRCLAAAKTEATLRSYYSADSNTDMEGEQQTDFTSPTDPIVQVKLCYLPSQMAVYIWYLGLCAVSFVSITFGPALAENISRRQRRRQRRGHYMQGEEEDGCEYSPLNKGHQPPSMTNLVRRGFLDFTKAIGMVLSFYVILLQVTS